MIEIINYLLLHEDFYFYSFSFLKEMKIILFLKNFKKNEISKYILVIWDYAQNSINNIIIF